MSDANFFIHINFANTPLGEFEPASFRSRRDLGKIGGLSRGDGTQQRKRDRKGEDEAQHS
jgi:hypothetical protein